MSLGGRAGTQQLGAHDDAVIPALRSVTRAVHEAGGKLALQIAHAGLWAARRRAGGAAPSRRSRSARRCGRPRPDLSVARCHSDEIASVVNAFADAAARAKAAGCDAVQIHAAHGYLLSEFLSPLFNQRTDAYGGSVPNRTRLVLRVVAAVRAAAGPDLPVLIKINSEDFVPGGLTMDEMLESAALIADAGVDAIELSGGTSLSGDLGPIRTRQGIAQDGEPYYEDASLKLKQKVRVPVMLVGGIRTFATAERLVQQGYADYISLSRPLICEPDLVARWERGDLSPSACRSDNRCFYKGLKREGMYCPHVHKGTRS